MADPGQESRSHDFSFCVCVCHYISVSSSPWWNFRQYWQNDEATSPSPSRVTPSIRSVFLFYFRNFASASLKVLLVHSTDKHASSSHGSSKLRNKNLLCNTSPATHTSLHFSGGEESNLYSQKLWSESNLCFDPAFAIYLRGLAAC